MAVYERTNVLRSIEDITKKKVLPITSNKVVKKIEIKKANKQDARWLSNLINILN